MQILMLGNSLTSANDLPALLANRLDAEVVAHTRGGARLSEQANPRTKLGAKTQQALAHGGWDFVVMQEMSNGPVRFPDRFLSSVTELAAAIRASGARPVLYGTWAYAPTCPKLTKLQLSHDEMHMRMHEANCRVAEQSGALLADVCQSFYEHSEKERLYAPDGAHPSPFGTEVAVETLAAVMAQPKPRPYTVYLLQCMDGSYYAGITTDVERRFQEHRSRGPKAARYTRTHPVSAIVATWEAPNRAAASRLEYRLKQLTHQQKCELAQNPDAFDGLIGSAWDE